MRIGCIQFSPVKGDIDGNITRADTVLRTPVKPQQKYNADGTEFKEIDIHNLDLVVLPELAFAGYGFKTASEIEPCLERSSFGVSALWARARALELNCNVVMGYAERCQTKTWEGKRVSNYNATLISTKEGDIIANHRKVHLQPADEIWAEEGDGGFYIDEVDPYDWYAVGISMDMNPKNFQGPWNDYGFAFHVLENPTGIVVVTMSWVSSDDIETKACPEEPDLDTVLFWISRLEPLINKNRDGEIIVIFCNRCGTQDGITFAGSTAVLGFLGEQVRVFGVLGSGTEQILKVDTEALPSSYCSFRPNEAMFMQRAAICRSLMHRPDVLGGLDSHPVLLTEASKAMHDRFNTSHTLEAKIKSMQPVSAIEPPTTWEKPRISNSGQPKKVPTALSLGKPTLPGSKAWDYMQPNVGTPSAPSPTPHTMRPRITVQPVESFTHRFIESQQEIEYQRRNTPHPEINISPTILSGYVNFDMPSATEISMSEFEMSPQVAQWADSQNRQHGRRPKPPPSISMRSEATVFSDWTGSEYGTVFSNMEPRGNFQMGAGITGPRTKTLMPQVRQATPAIQSRPRAKTSATPVYGPPGRGANDPDTPISPLEYSNSPVIHRRGTSDIANFIFTHSEVDDPEDFYRFYKPNPPPQPVYTRSPQPVAPQPAAPRKADTPDPFNSKTTRPRGNSTTGSQARTKKEEQVSTHPRGDNQDQASISSSLFNNHRGRRSKRGYRYEDMHVTQTASNTRTGRKRSTSRLVDLSQFRRVEEYPSPNCPVHGKKIQRALSQDRLDFYIGNHSRSRSYSTGPRNLSTARPTPVPDKNTEKGPPSAHRGTSATRNAPAAKRNTSATRHRTTRSSQASNSITAVRQRAVYTPSSARDNTASRQGKAPTPSLTNETLGRHDTPDNRPWVETWMPPLSSSVPPGSFTVEQAVTKKDRLRNETRSDSVPLQAEAGERKVPRGLYSATDSNGKGGNSSQPYLADRDVVEQRMPYLSARS